MSAGDQIINSNISKPLTRLARFNAGFNDVVKRLFDILTSSVVLLFSSPFFLLIAIAIKRDSPGPVFYRGIRTGKNGKPFHILKFRTMDDSLTSYEGPRITAHDDQRVTSIGRWLRDTKLNEFPQFWNVLKGEMSLVGPRPERPYFVDMLAEQIPYYRRRLKVRPGITGWAQVKHKYDESIEDVKVKLRYDLFYIENMSFRMDIKILARTILVVLFGKGHYN